MRDPREGERYGGRCRPDRGQLGLAHSVVQ
jgi:hypothetical protein